MGLNSTNKLWRKDEIAALIALFETEPCLYDNKHKHFNDCDKQREAYERIHSVMTRIRPSCTVGEIKYKLNFLLRQYSGEVLHRNISIQAGVCTEESYKSGMWCFGLLQFLDEYLPVNNSQKKVSSVEDVNKDPVEEVTTVSNTSSQDYREEASSSESVTENDVVEDNAEQVSQRNCRKKRKSFHVTPPSSPKFTSENVPLQSSPDREDIFGQYIASEMKNLKDNPLLYLQTKQSILQILTSANFELINPE